MPYTNRPSNHITPAPGFTSDGTCARFVKIDDVWHISLAPELAEIVQVGTTVTCDVETRAGRRYTRSGTVIRKRRLRDGTPRALCSIEEYRAGRAHDERNTFALLPDGSWGVRLHVAASRNARPGEVRDIAVTAKSGRVSHVTAKITDIVENEQGDRQAIATIVARDRTREPAFEADHGVTAACPSCGTTACDSGITGHCRISPEYHTDTRGDFPLADTPREDLDLPIEPIGRAQDWDHWSARIGRGEFVR